MSGLRCGAAAAVDRSWKTCKARNFEWKSPFSPRHWPSKPPGASAHLTSQPWRDGAGGNSYSINTENWLCLCVCTNMTNLWWPLLNFPRNQDIFFASSLHDDGHNLQTSPGAVLYILGGKISKLGIGYKHRILCLLFGDKNFIVLLRKFYVHAKESKRFYPWFFSTSSRKYLPILYINL